MNKTKLNITIISNFCYPEKGAAPYRIFNMAKELNEVGHRVTILAGIPNYPTGKIFDEYKGKFLFQEEIDEIVIRRHWLYPSNSSNPFVRIFSMLTFSVTLWFSFFWLLRNKQNTVIVQSPPLLVGLSGAILGRIVCKDTVLNVSDMWPHTAVDLGVIRAQSLTFKFFSIIEKLMYKFSNRFICQAQSVKEYLFEKNSTKDVFLYRNLSKSSINVKDKEAKDLTVIVYAGLLGIAQGVLEICMNLDFKSIGCEFHIYGDGAQKDELLKLSQERKDIVIHNSVPKEKMQSELLKYDATIIPLKTFIRGAMPSKVYMAISANLPIFFHGKGDGADTVSQKNLGYVSQKDNYSDLCENIKHFTNLSQIEKSHLNNSIYNASKGEFNYFKQQAELIQFIEKNEE